MLMFDVLGQEADGTFAVCAPGCTKYETYLVSFYTPEGETLQVYTTNAEGITIDKINEKLYILMGMEHKDHDPT